MTKTMLDILGTLFLVIGVAGFATPDMGGMHLSPAHNAIHFLTGAVTLWAGLRSAPCAARKISWSFALFYGALAFAGFALGRPEADIAGMPSDPRLLTVIPGWLVLGQNDHVLHLIFAVVLAAAAIMGRAVSRPAESQRTA